MFTIMHTCTTITPQ